MNEKPSSDHDDSALASVSGGNEKRKRNKSSGFSDLKYIICVAVLIISLPIFVFGHYKIASENMLPTLDGGDHVYVNKLAYGASRHSLGFGSHKLPFLKDGRILARQPKPGDVVVFRSPNDANLVIIKRLVGLPGDEVKTSQGRLYINGELVDRTSNGSVDYRGRYGTTTTVTQYQEQLNGEKVPHQIYEQNDIQRLDNSGPYIVPKNTYFFMGDNRDNSRDSRAPGGPGFVPFDHLIGRVEMIIFSSKKCEPDFEEPCPAARTFKKI